MPVFEYYGPTPAWRKKFTLDGNGNRLELFPDEVSEPIDYVRDNGDEVKGRQFEVGEHVACQENPDPVLFLEVV